DGGTRNRRAVGFHEAADAVERLGGDAAAVAQPRGELAVVDGAPAEGRFRKSAVPAIVGDFLQQVLRVHGLYASTFRSDLRAPRLGTAWERRRSRPTANQARRGPSTTKRPTTQVGSQMGRIPTTERANIVCASPRLVGCITRNMWHRGKRPTRWWAEPGLSRDGGIERTQHGAGDRGG